MREPDIFKRKSMLIVRIRLIPKSDVEYQRISTNGWIDELTQKSKIMELIGSLELTYIRSTLELELESDLTWPDHDLTMTWPCSDHDLDLDLDLKWDL